MRSYLVLIAAIRPIHTRDQSALEVHLKSSRFEIYFGEKVQ